MSEPISDRMPDVETRLTRCFQAVFPTVDRSALPALQRDRTTAWDSMASVTLVRVIEEEFGIPIDLFDIEDLKSFEDLRHYIARNSP